MHQELHREEGLKLFKVRIPNDSNVRKMAMEEVIRKNKNKENVIVYDSASVVESRADNNM